MQQLRAELARVWERFGGLLSRNALARYAAASALVLMTVAIRAGFDPIFNPGVYYHLYYPAVIVSAYWLGAKPGVFAACLSAALAYWLFSAPVFQFKTDIHAYLPLISFLLSSAVAVFVLAHLRQRLVELRRDYHRIDAFTLQQADLFREHAGRVSNHLQLISALLQHQARDAGHATLSRVLMNAASRTLLISRMHRAFTGADKDRIDFKAFAVRLVEAALTEQGRPPLAVRVEGARLDLPLEQATSLGLMLLECVNARAALRTPGVMRIAIGANDGQGVFRVVEDNTAETPERDLIVLNAIAEQMRGSLVLAEDGEESVLRLSFPTALQPLPAWEPLQPVH